MRRILRGDWIFYEILQKYLIKATLENFHKHTDFYLIKFNSNEQKEIKRKKEFLKDERI